jgi:hypothetical protein
MDAAPFDPFRAQRALLWRNRIAAWRAESAQSLWHGLALLMLLALLAPVLLRTAEALGPSLRSALVRWPLAIMLGTSIVLAWPLARRLARLRESAARDWLAALPIASTLHRRRRRDVVLGAMALQALAGTVLLLALDAGVRAHVGLLGCVLAAGLIAIPLAHRVFARRAAAWWGSRLSDPGPGRLWRWQRIETGAALRGRALAFGLWALLLVPIGIGPFAVLAVAAAGLLLAAMATAWRRMLDVLPQAQAWLAPQPLSGARLVRGTVLLPAALLVASASLLAVLLSTLGAPGLALITAGVTMMLGSLQFACVAAHRAQPRRIGLQWLVQVALLVAAAQAFAPLVLPLWLLQMFVLLRRAARR